MLLKMKAENKHNKTMMKFFKLFHQWWRWRRRAIKYQVLPSGTKTGGLAACLSSSACRIRACLAHQLLCVPVCVRTSVWVCVKTGHVRAQTACRAPHADEQGHRSAWQRKERSVFMSVSVHACVYSGEGACVRLWVRQGGSESASLGIFCLFPTLPLFLSTSHFVPSSLPLLLTHFFHPSSCPPSLTHPPDCLSFSDSSSRGPGACWWRVHRSFPSCGGGCKHTQRHMRTHQIPNLEAVAVDVRRIGVRPNVTPWNLSGVLQLTSGSLSKTHVCTHTNAKSHTGTQPGIPSYIDTQSCSFECNVV